MIFRGRFEYTIDPKGRVNVPARFREQLQESGQETFFVTNNDKCLYVFPSDYWTRIEETLSRQVSSFDTKLNNFVRFFLGAAVEVVPDKQGRIVIPPSLRTYAALEKDVVISGVLTRFEIWSRERWDAEVARYETELAADQDLVQRLKSLGI